MNRRNSSKIAKNTLYLYIRLILVMVVTLYTSRVVLNSLGVIDFGIYNVISGLALSFIFFSSTLSNSTQRFLNVELSKGNEGKTADVFNLSILIYTFIGFCVFILMISLGFSFIDSKLQIPLGRLFAAKCVLFTFSVSFFVQFFSITFDAVLIAHENMRIYAFVGLIDAILKLGVAFLISVVPFDKLIVYSLLLMFVTIAIRSIPIVYCLRLYPECHFYLYWNRKEFKDMFRFIGWSGLGNVVWALNEQGMSILLNIFFGPIVNASKGIANQVNSAVNNFTSNFYVAVRPQIVDSYTNRDFAYLTKLVFSSSKFGYFLMWLMCAPIIFRSDYILHLWLGNVPEYAPSFTNWVLIFSLVNVLTGPFWSAIQAVGKLKSYIVYGSIVYMLAFPLSYLFLQNGHSPIIVFQCLVSCRIVYLFVIIFIVHRYIPYSIKEYLLEVILRSVLVTCLSYPIIYCFSILFPCTLAGLILFAGCSIVSNLLIFIFVGMTQKERIMLVSKINKL